MAYFRGGNLNHSQGPILSQHIEGPLSLAPAHVPQCHPTACTVCIKPLRRASSAGGPPEQPHDNPYIHLVHLRFSTIHKGTTIFWLNREASDITMGLLCCCET